METDTLFSFVRQWIDLHMVQFLTLGVNSKQTIMTDWQNNLIVSFLCDVVFTERSFRTDDDTAFVCAWNTCFSIVFYNKGNQGQCPWPIWILGCLGFPEIVSNTLGHHRVEI